MSELVKPALVGVVPGEGEDARVAAGVYRQLLALLITREIAPGDRVSIDGTARRLDVSQTPVREALAQLEREDLVTRTHQAGYRAAPLLTEAQFENLFEIRLLVEPFAAQKAAERGSLRESGELEQTSAEMLALAQTIEPPTYGEFASADARLHDLLAASGGNPLLRETLARLHSHVHLFRLHYHARVSLDAIDEHDAILSAVREGDVEGAGNAMRSHLERSYARLRVAFDLSPQGGV